MLIEEFSEWNDRIEVEGEDYLVRVMGAERPQGGWVGWLLFERVSDGAAFPTSRETTQPSRAALGYWASGLEPVYFEGALRRARRQPIALSDDFKHRGPVPVAPEQSKTVELAVESISARLPGALLGTALVKPGMERWIPSGGILAYRTSEKSNGVLRHHFELQFNGEQAAAVLANWLRSHLARVGATLRINGETVPAENRRIQEALLHRPGWVVEKTAS